MIEADRVLSTPLLNSSPVHRPMFPPVADSVHAFSPQPAIRQPESRTLATESRKPANGIGRRSILAALAFLPIAVPAPAAQPDPIYAVIEQHRALSAAFTTACERPDYAQAVRPEPEVEDFVDAAGEALWGATERLLTFQPATFPGLVAMLRYLSGLEDWQLPGHFTDDFEDMQELSATMATAIEAIIRQGGAA